MEINANPTHYGYKNGDECLQAKAACSKRNLPAWKHEHDGMLLDGGSENLRVLDTQIHSTVLDGREGGLMDPREKRDAAPAPVGVFVFIANSPQLAYSLRIKALFVELPAFSRFRGDYLDDEGFRALQNPLMENPAGNSGFSPCTTRTKWQT